jgi:hypothetical protein
MAWLTNDGHSAEAASPRRKGRAGQPVQERPHCNRAESYKVFIIPCSSRNKYISGDTLDYCLAIEPQLANTASGYSIADGKPKPLSRTLEYRQNQLNPRKKSMAHLKLVHSRLLHVRYRYERNKR